MQDSSIACCKRVTKKNQQKISLTTIFHQSSDVRCFTTWCSPVTCINSLSNKYNKITSPNLTTRLHCSMDILLPSEKHKNVLLFLLGILFLSGVACISDLYFFIDNGPVEKIRCLINKQTDKSM